MTAEDPLRTPLRLLAAVLLGTGLWMAVSPSSFHEALADFGAYDPHGLRDNATFPVAAGVLLLVSVRRVSWRAPVLALVALQHLLHAVNHAIDIGDADPGWVGPVDLLSLLALSAMLVWALRRAEAGAPR